ncbi:hypothetical protein F4604DRAFT_1687851 [Suillus subluteus]|nr:hypothetical protein F4604DRAFT_1687851 [Suillus subluteus]
MSQPASQHIRTRPKNATQHPGRIVLEAEGRAKRRSKAQMIADRQRELEEKEASEQAIQQGHQHIATLQEQMATDQAAAHINAPKPKHPHARPIKKGAKPSATSELSMANGEAGAEVAADKVIGAKGKHGGSGGMLAAGANIENPASDEELDAQPVKDKSNKKALKMPVRDAIQAVAGAESLIDPSTKARDGDIHQMSVAKLQTPAKKFNLAGRIPDWRSNLPTSKAAPSTAPSVQRSITSRLSSAPSSRLTNTGGRDQFAHSFNGK